ncbi:MAG: GntR family transcriptional regulator [Rhodomicrobium sp.]|nr:GntR family transcriptional regulator [Rhodomicrobium sp.]
MNQSSKIKKADAKDALSRIPRYLQVAGALRQRINSGHWSVGDKIATLEQLENEFQVARVTIRQAVDLLQQEGLLKSEQGRGTFVTKAEEPDRWLQLSTNWDALMRPIRHNTLRHLPVEQPFKPKYGPEDGAPAEAYTAIYSLQLRQDQPYALARVHVAKDIYDRAMKAFKEQIALGVLFEMKDVTIARAHQMMSIGTADVYAAAHLRLPFGAPVMEARCTVNDADGRLIYIGEIVYRGDVIRINIELFDDARRN